MSGFKQITQTFLMVKAYEYFGNIVKNYNDPVCHYNFFRLVEDNFGRSKAVDLIRAAFSPKELELLKQLYANNFDPDLDTSLAFIFQMLWNHRRSRCKCRCVLDAIRTYQLERYRVGYDDRLKRRFDELRNVMKLSDLEYEILVLTYVAVRTRFNWPKNLSVSDKPVFYAMALDRTYDEVLTAIKAKGRLMRYAVLDGEWDFNGESFDSYIDGSDDEAVERRFYRPCPTREALPWHYYGELASEHGELLKRLLTAGAGRCNILLYGVPGSGKTSFAHSLAREAGLTAFEITQGGEEEKTASAASRMTGIRICNEQEAGNGAVMIIDEADELLRSGYVGNSDMEFVGGRSTEKGVTNTLLDEMRMPAIWIANTPADAMDESVRRRFDYSVYFRRINRFQRVSTWRNLVRKFDLERKIPEAAIEAYVARYPTSPGGISNVLNNVKRLDPPVEEVEEIIASLMRTHCELMGIQNDSDFLPTRGYDLEGLNIKGQVGLPRIVQALRNFLDPEYHDEDQDPPRMNLLLFGPPGTGKTEFVKFLGKELGCRVKVVRGSDILSRWVGASEQNIAAAFAETEESHAILFFDEVDGLVQDRAGASQSWEVTQVNEFLQQMEQFDGIMVAATNFSRNLDKAMTRRFTYKLEFGYLDEEGKRVFFERVFKAKLTPTELEELRSLHNLTPGDFRTVRQSLFYLDDAQTNAARIAALREECTRKRDGQGSGTVGF